MTSVETVSTPSRFWGHFRFRDSILSLSLGIGVVFLAAIVTFFILQFRHVHSTATLRQETTSAKTTAFPQQPAHSPATTMPSANTEKIYTVKQGDDLWHIAINTYNNGYKWVDIAKVNNLHNPGLLYAGMKLQLPVVSPQAAETETLPTLGKQLSNTEIAQKSISEQSISSNTSSDTYTVQKGDNLWNIAVSKYNDGFKWGEIATANNLANPRIIHAGNILRIPRNNNP